MAADEQCCKPMFWVYLIVCVVLVLFAGLMSGLTLGLMSLSQVDLEVLSKSGQPKDQKNAAKILPVVKNQHLLLCTLLLGNSLAMEALPIFLDALLPAWGAVIISVTLILAFGEIIPQAVCTRFGMSVGAKLVGVVRVALFVFFPITYPISKLLDWLLGKGHRALLRRAELKTLVDMHGNAAGKGGDLTHDETTIITGALDLTQKTAKDAMTPIDKTFALDINSKLDMHTMGLIMSKGNSRVPIYSENPSNIVGLFLVKNLIICRPEDQTPIRNVSIRRIPRVPEQMPLYNILNEFQKGHSHMAVVVKGMKDVKRTSESLRSRSTTLGRRVNLSRSQTIAEHKESYPSVVLDVVADPSSSIRSGGNNSNLRNGGENENHTRQISKEWDREIIVEAELQSLPSYPPEEEVIGIITMEDVIEELLQEEIYDETDQYNEAHNRIKVDMPSTRPSSKSSQASPHSNVQHQTPVASPVSIHHHTTPVFQSPVSSYIHSPGGSRHTLSSSPVRNHFPSSPSDQFVTPGQNSPDSNRVSVSRKPDEVSGKPDEKPKFEDL